MGCSEWVLLALGTAVVVLIVRSVEARNRLRVLEEAMEQLRSSNAELKWRLQDRARKEAPRQAEVQAAPAPPPVSPQPAPEPVPEAPLPPAAPPPAFLPPAAPQPVPKPAFDWESLVGVQLFSWMAGIMLAIAGILFLRYSIQYGWLTEPVQMAIGLMTGTGLLVLCEWKAARRYAATANALDAAGIAILFSTLFAAHSLWQLLSAAPAFLLMALVAAVAVALALRHDSPFIAVLGLLGGFATPALLSTGDDRPLALFSYLLLLNAGLAWASLQRRWVMLIRLALALTFLYQWGWVLRFLDPERIPLALGIFLVFPVVFLLAAAVSRGKAQDEEDGGFGQVAAVSAGLPFLLAVYLAAAPGYGDHWELLFGFVAILTLGVGAVALAMGLPLLLAAALAGGQIVMGVCAVRGEVDPPSVTVLAAAALAVIGMACAVLAGWRRSEKGRGFGGAAAVGLFAAQLAVISMISAGNTPPLSMVLAAQAAFAAGLLYLSWRFALDWLAPASVVTAFLAAALWDGGTWERPIFAAVLLGIYLGYPLILGERARQRRGPWLAAVLASVAFFMLVLEDLRELGFRPILGLLPLLQAAALGLLLRRLLALEPAGERDEGRLVTVAGALLAFVTVAIPLQLEKQWMTLGWALLAAALAWLYGRVPHRGLLAWIAGLAAAVFVRLSLNPAVLSYHPRSDLPIWNWYLYTYLIAAAAFLTAAWLLHRTVDDLVEPLPRLSVLLDAGAGVLLFLLLNIEIADFYSTGPTLTFGFLSGRSSLAEGLTYTLGWAVFALALLVTGIAVRSRAARVTAIGLLLATVLKGFLLDLAVLEGLYRVASFVGMAACLAAVAVLIQRFVLERRVEE